MKTIHLSLLLVLTGTHTPLVAARADTMLGVPGHSNSTPWVAASGKFVALTWAAASAGAKNGDIFVAVSRDAGATFGQPVRVNAVSGEARISGEIAPRIAVGAKAAGDPLITVTWNAKGETTQIKTARSRDGGRTFIHQNELTATDVAGERGWQASAVDARGTLHTVWLDHRAMAAAKAAGDRAEHTGEHDGVAMAQRSGLYYAADGVPERELFKGVCYCCKTAMATGPRGEIFAAWRHVFAGNMRDMAFTVSRDGGKTFAPLLRVNQDGWSIQGCPDDGPAIAVDAKGVVHLAWPTVKNEQGMILYATSTDGRSFSAPRQLPSLGGPKPSHPHIAVGTSGRVFVAWDESKAGIRTAAIAQVGSTRAPDTLGSATTYPVLAATDTGLVAAWTSGPPDRSMIGVRVIQ